MRMAAVNVLGVVALSSAVLAVDYVKGLPGNLAGVRSAQLGNQPVRIFGAAGAVAGAIAVLASESGNNVPNSTSSATTSTNTTS
jgi:hypothetical protein